MTPEEAANWAAAATAWLFVVACLIGVIWLASRLVVTWMDRKAEDPFEQWRRENGVGSNPPPSGQRPPAPPPPPPPRISRYP